MMRSSFDQPPPAAWLRDLAGGAPRGRNDIVFNPYPAASLVSTPADMGRFIAAHLFDPSSGSLGSEILSPTATETMHASHWRPQPDVPSVAFGFFEGTLNDRRTLFHTGDSGDHSLVLLLPDENVGLYFVFSGTDEQVEARDRFARAFMDTFFPRKASSSTSLITSTAAPIPVSQLTGIYRTASYSRSNYEKVRALFAQVRVTAGDGDTLVIAPPGASARTKLVRVGTLTFQRDSGETIAFRQSPNGRIVGFTLSGLIWDPSSWDRISWWEDGRLHLATLGTAIGLLGLRLVWTPVAWIARALRRDRATNISPAMKRIWRWSAMTAMTFVLAPVAGAGTALLSFMPPVRAIPRAVTVVTTLLVIAVAAGLVLGWPVIRAWHGHERPRPRLIVATTTVTASMALAILLWYWNLLAPWSVN